MDTTHVTQLSNLIVVNVTTICTYKQLTIRKRTLLLQKKIFGKVKNNYDSNKENICVLKTLGTRKDKWNVFGEEKIEKKYYLFKFNYTIGKIIIDLQMNET